jgi:hypothetical protein
LDGSVILPFLLYIHIYNKVIKGNKMSNMTNRLSDSQLADIAKQKYETEQINRVPGVVVDLPRRISISRIISFKNRYRRNAIHDCI